MVVEDEKPVRILIARLLQLSDFTVLEADDGQGGLIVFRNIATSILAFFCRTDNAAYGAIAEVTQ